MSQKADRFNFDRENAERRFQTIETNILVLFILEKNIRSIGELSKTVEIMTLEDTTI